MKPPARHDSVYIASLSPAPSPPSCGEEGLKDQREHVIGNPFPVSLILIRISSGSVTGSDGCRFPSHQRH